MQIKYFFVITFFSILYISCGGGNNNSDANNAHSDTTNIIAPRAIEKTLNVKFKTQLVEWGGDGKWHDMIKENDSSYWVNYSDPFKIVLSGYYTDLSIKIVTSMGDIIFEKTGISVTENKEYVVTNAKMIGGMDTNFNLEIVNNGSLIYKSKIESIPGGE